MRHQSVKTAGIAVLGLGVLFAGGCESLTESEGTARIQVLLTDAPHELLESAVVTIGQVSIVAEGAGPVVLSDEAAEFDLLELRDGVTARLADLEIEAGRYVQLRLIVTSAEVTLLEAYAFPDGSRTQALKVPSGAQSGIKINLRPPAPAEGEDEDAGEGIEITGDETIVVDFDVAQNFKVMGNPNTPAGIKGFLFTPLLRAVVLTDAGSISGTVTDQNGDPVAGATLSATPLEMGEVAEGETAVAMAMSAEDGTYTIRFLRPGDYRVSVASDVGAADPRDVVVQANQDVPDVDFQLVP
jgi:hypothetical protein